MNIDVESVLAKLSTRKHLKEKEVNFVCEFLFQEGDDDVKAEILFALTSKGETIDEVSNFIKYIRKSALIDLPQDAIDIVGTGGDGYHTFNISSCCSLLMAATGRKVIKHGNRAVSGKFGSADFFEMIGLGENRNINGGSLLKDNLDRYNLAFLFAPEYYPLFKHVKNARKIVSQKYESKTIFNILGPLLNPAMPKRALIGAYSYDKAELMADVALKMDLFENAVFFSSDGCDEINPNTITTCFHLKDGRVAEYDFSPQFFGVSRIDFDAIRVNNVTDAYHILEQVKSGSLEYQVNHILWANLAIALYVYDETPVPQCVIDARDIITSGSIVRLIDKITNDKLWRYTPQEDVQAVSDACEIPIPHCENILDLMKHTSFIGHKNRVAKSSALPLFEKLLDPSTEVNSRMIAEVKFRTPMRGKVAEEGDFNDILLSFKNAGYSNVSVLTEEFGFGGNVKFLPRVREEFGHEAIILQKDFISHPSQIFEGVKNGANAFLCIVGMLKDREISLISKCTDRIYDVIYEVHSHEEFERLSALIDISGKIIGVNNRDLRTGNTDINVSYSFVETLQNHPETVFISESGLSSKSDITSLIEVGYKGFLVGTSLCNKEFFGKN